MKRSLQQKQSGLKKKIFLSNDNYDYVIFLIANNYIGLYLRQYLC